VGEYTALLALFSYNKVVPVVDGNVFRFYYFDVETDIALAKKKEFAAQLSVNDNPAIRPLWNLVL
jgi:adenine-specific DNA glycosylase